MRRLGWVRNKSSLSLLGGAEGVAQQQRDRPKDGGGVSPNGDHISHEVTKTQRQKVNPKTVRPEPVEGVLRF